MLKPNLRHESNDNSRTHRSASDNIYQSRGSSDTDQLNKYMESQYTYLETTSSEDKLSEWYKDQGEPVPSKEPLRIKVSHSHFNKLGQLTLTCAAVFKGLNDNDR